MYERKSGFTLHIEPTYTSNDSDMDHYEIIVTHTESGSQIFAGVAPSLEEAERLGERELNLAIKLGITAA